MYHLINLYITCTRKLTMCFRCISLGLDPIYLALLYTVLFISAEWYEIPHICNEHDERVLSYLINF